MQISTLWHGIARIQSQVHKHLLDACRVSLHQYCSLPVVKEIFIFSGIVRRRIATTSSVRECKFSDRTSIIARLLKSRICCTRLAARLDSPIIVSNDLITSPGRSL